VSLRAPNNVAETSVELQEVVDGCPGDTAAAARWRAFPTTMSEAVDMAWVPVRAEAKLPDEDKRRAAV
jgi:hypothetical protein